MAERLIGSLLYDDHPEPRKARPWKDRLKAPVALFLVVGITGGLLYKFANYREEFRVQEFLEAVMSGRHEEAYGMWDADERYRMEHFLEDWGDEGYYTSSGRKDFEVVDSNSTGPAVTVYASVDDAIPVAIRVDKESLLLSYSPQNKYAGR